MKNWRNEILKHFSEPIPALTIVADPDELLCDESLFGIESDTFGRGRLRLLEQIYHTSEKLVGKRVNLIELLMSMDKLYFCMLC